ncbi:bifunctional 3,4-dihydroxy-2-butanone-4-phosphate synthase/GTP cyclohydrolase II [Lactobacillus ultunensis]|uniref:GTP cyclohydrolase-2 n=1 Tax=Lactobacillus ultunensis DSM 16047 TaxID=525365 RepID=C2EN88_9LACO|nr:bifunctional 3,4-dihydroxy-2-butanone-4-phosphate synthase/GTP cyclohydrolase II [Lactobacillus ultunensis]EEJ71892.1 GTP cyclohydrolase II [Lactobacillus ultunensis DSM 16047]KRL82109.1 3,4-dihydroxy-2-butanone-4-phosphate synthase [Lactobacillus ultunensis DSM 16047]QQP27692.1 bifunctional 3,4-dihydroxy-2-butanone-4-phosphate synthase/GTP cyclohydrolase II [Lactobacillus ultunensis]
MDVKKIQNAIDWMKKGGLVIVADDEDRESEGDMIGLGSKVTPENVNFMTKHARGLLCTPVSKKIAERLKLPQMQQDNTDPYGTAFTISVDYKTTTTGISAYDRATTIKAIANPNSKPEDFFRPGHCFPLVAKDDQIKQRNGHTEASIALAHLAGEPEVAYICEVMKPDGHMARRTQLRQIAKEYHMPFLTIAELQEYINSPASKLTDFVNLPTEYGEFKIKSYGHGNVALIKGNIDPSKPVLTRVHSKCLTGDTFGSKRCDCGPQLHQSMKKIEENGSGVILYLNQEGRGIGLTNKLRAYALQDQGHDTYEANELLGFKADERNYDVAAKMFKDLGIKVMDLLTNNPDKIDQLADYGITINQRIPLEIKPNKFDLFYLKTKKEKFHHLLKLKEAE